MTRAIHPKFHKNETNSVNGYPLSTHLRNHVHLTNCIHLRNHMHLRRSPVVPSERSLMRDLIALQRSRSLRDPSASASPPSWISPTLGRKPREVVASSKVVALETSSDDEGSEIENGRNARKSVSDYIGRKSLSEHLEKNIRGDRIRESEIRGVKRKKKRRVRGVRRVGGEVVDLKCSSQSSAQGKCGRREGEGEDTEMRVPKNGCGIPWNWSGIHHRGKTFLDIAGRSLSCGRSDPRLKKGEKEVSSMPIGSDQLTSSTGSDSEVLPLLSEPSGYDERNGDGFLVQDYSGELGIYVGNSSRRGLYSDIDSQSRSGSSQQISSGGRSGRHQSLTQKYMPKTFQDFVGQNLVVQALSNAVLRRKVGLVYVFYGPSGTGKTSCARVFAKALNCQSVERPKPCDSCSSCMSHNMGKSQNVMEVGPVSAFNYENIMEVFVDKTQYQVFIVDDCDSLPSDSWSAVLKVINRAPRRVVFILIGSSLDHFPHIIISRCQKFFFPKLKDSSIIYKLQLIATREGLQIHKDALRLIAMRSDGSLRDAEMTLDQLSLLGQRITLPLVQELVGLVSDEKLVDLLDLALSADTVNTVKSLRDIMETGVDPLALMSQIATIITDILAGSYVFTRENLRQKFFHRLTLSKRDMEKLRQALRKLSEAEKQLRLSNDKLTWLTAALLQIAPDQHYTLPTSSEYTSLHHSPVIANNIRYKDLLRNSSGRGLSRGNRVGNDYSDKLRNDENVPETSVAMVESNETNGRYKSDQRYKDNEKIWRVVLEKIQSDTVKHFLFHEGKLSSVSFGAAPTVQLIFSSQATKSKAEKFRRHILQAFESTLHSEVLLEIKCEVRKDITPDIHTPLNMVTSENSSRMILQHQSTANQQSHLRDKKFTKRVATKNVQGRGEITEVVPSPQEHAEIREEGPENMWLNEASPKKHQGNSLPSVNKENEAQRRRLSLVRRKVSLAHVIQQVEGSAQQAGLSRRKAVSIAEKLEQENLRLEPQSRILRCWRVPRVTRSKLPHLRIRTRKSQYMLKIVTCGRCL